MRKKVLLMPAYSFPEQDSSSHLGNDRDTALVKNGYDLVLYAATPTRGVSEEVRKQYRKIKHETRYDGHMVVHRYYLPREKDSAFLRAIRYTLQCFKLFNKAIFSRDARNCDVMWMSSTPPMKCAFLGFAKKFTKIPLIYNLQDIFPDSLAGSGMATKGGFLWKIGDAISNYAYKQADKITVISKDFKTKLLSKGVPEEKIKLIYNWVDEQQVVSINREDNVLFDRYHLDRSKFYLTYCGNVGLTQNFELVLTIMKELQNEYPDIILVIIGNGAFRQTVGDIIRQDNLTNVILLPFQPYEEISYVFSLGDVGLVISKPGVGENSVPSKTWSIMSASRPVLASFDENELKDIIIHNRCGVFTRSGDKQAFKEAVLKLYNDQSLCEEYGKNGRLFLEDNLSKDKCLSQFISLVNEVVNQ